MASKTAPTAANAQAHAARLFEEGHFEEAADVIRAELATRESSEMYNDLAVVELASAGESLRRALAIDPQNADAAKNLGVLLFSVGNLREAAFFLLQGLAAAGAGERAHLELLREICVGERKPAASSPARVVDPVPATPPPVSRRVVEGDVDILVRETFFPDATYQGTLIEVGAARPDFLSVSESFRPLGWRVISIEPNPYFCEMHRARGHAVISCACGDTDQDDVPFFVVRVNAPYHGEPVTNESFSSLGVRGKYAEMMHTMPSAMDEIRVNVRRLDTLLAEATPPVDEIDILCVDVEGWELEVLNGLSFDRHAPKVLIVENLFVSPAYVDYAASKGYALWQRLEPNDIFVRLDLIAARALHPAT